MYRFGDHDVDPARRELRRRGEVVHLEPQAFDLLVHLIEHRDEVVAHRDLLDGVWGHPFVSAAAITTRIKEIRRAVGDDGRRQHTIRNVRGRGYRFVAELDESAPTPATGTLVGRERELASVLDHLRGSRVVTIAGPGGVGKSTLASEVPRRVAGSFHDGVHLVELASVERPDQVLPAVAQALGVVLDPDAPRHAVSTIARLDALVVVDNCEHVVDEVARLVDETIRDPLGAVRVLATSQIRLGVPGEHVVTLAPLDRDGALRLFDARARAISREWALEQIGVGRVLAVLDHLDRLPLTVEMAAARLGSMTFDELEAAVVEQGGWPVRMTHRTPSRRHRSLASLVDWSVGLLDDDQRRAFEDLSVFADAVTMADVVAVLGPEAPDAVMVAVADLVDRSLLLADLERPAARYRMLDSVKRVAAEMLDASGRGRDVRDRHAAAVADVVAAIDRDLRTAAETAGRRRFDALVAEVRQAHLWAQDSAPEIVERLAAALHLTAYGRLWSEPAMWSARAVERAAGDVSRLAASRLLIAGAEVNAGHLAPARTTLEDVLATAADPAVVAVAHELMSDLCLYSGDLAGCDDHATELGRIGVDLGDGHMIALSATNASLVLTFSGHPAEASARLAEVSVDGLAPSSRAWLAYARAEACSALTDHGGAVAAYEEAIERAASVENPFVVSVALSSLAAEHARSGSPRRSLDAYLSCLDLLRRHGNLVHGVTTLRNLVTLLARCGEDRGAVVIATAASAPELRPTFGAESEDLAAVLEEIRGRVGSGRYGEWASAGRDLGVSEAVLHARSVVTSLLERGEGA